MRKKSTRLLSAALAVCMMLSVLPVGAFALEVGAADPAAAVSEQEAATPYHLDGGKKSISMRTLLKNTAARIRLVVKRPINTPLQSTRIKM